MVRSRTASPEHVLRDGSRVAVVGGGPAGSFFSYFALRVAERVGRRIEVDLYEPRDFSRRGPKGCNMCGGIVSESLVQRLAAEGLHLPPAVVQRRIDSYVLHMDVGSVRIATPLRELRIAAVARGSGPRIGPDGVEGLDAFLIDLAQRRGARRLAERVTEVRLDGGRPSIVTREATRTGYDLFVGACGVNSSLLANLELERFRPPRATRAYIAEFHLGRRAIDRHLGSSMHVFLLNLPRLDFAALIPKDEYATFCLLGERIDRDLVRRVLGSREVREVLPPRWDVPDDFCHCSPLLNVGGVARPYGERTVLVGDSGCTRLFKDGIGAAYRTAKAAARTAVLRGVSEADFRAGYAPVCRSIQADNRVGRLVFGMTGLLQRTRGARRALWRTTSREQKLRRAKRRTSRILWNTFTGSAPYRSVLAEGLHPGVWGRIAWEYACGVRFGDEVRPPGRVGLASGRTGAESRRYAAGEHVFRRGDPAGGMFLVHRGRVELAGEGAGPPALVGPGEFFGEMALFGDEPRSADAIAREDSLLFVLERDSLLLRLHEDPPMALRLVEAMARRAERVEAGLVRGTGPGPEPERARKPPVRTAPALAGSSNLLGRAFQPGETIYRQGDRGSGMFAVQGGALELARREGAREVRVALLEEGDLFGEGAIFLSEVRSSTARALRRSHVLTLERESLLESIADDPSVALHMLENLARRIARMESGGASAAPPRNAEEPSARRQVPP